MQARRRAAKEKAGSASLDELIASGEPGAYEALQLFRSRALRAFAKGEKMSSLRIAVEGSIKLIQGTYFAAGMELCNQLFDFLNEMEQDISSPDIRELVFSVDDALIAAVGGGVSSEEDLEAIPKNSAALKTRQNFLKSAVKWTQTYGRREYGYPPLHLRFADALWDEDNSRAIYHYAAGESPVVVAQRISSKFSQKASFALRDQAITTAIVHFLALENLKDANECMSQFKKAQKNRDHSIDSKLITFCVQLLECCRRDAKPLYAQLLAAITPELNKWPSESVQALLNGSIGAKFFKIQPKVNPMIQMMQQMLA